MQLYIICILYNMFKYASNIHVMNIIFIYRFINVYICITHMHLTYNVYYTIYIILSIIIYLHDRVPKLSCFIHSINKHFWGRTEIGKLFL